MLCIYQNIVNIHYINICVLILISFLINDVFSQKLDKYNIIPLYIPNMKMNNIEKIFLFLEKFQHILKEYANL